MKVFVTFLSMMAVLYTASAHAAPIESVTCKIAVVEHSKEVPSAETTLFSKEFTKDLDPSQAVQVVFKSDSEIFLQDDKYVQTQLGMDFFVRTTTAKKGLLLQVEIPQRDGPHLDINSLGEGRIYQFVGVGSTRVIRFDCTRY